MNAFDRPKSRIANRDPGVIIDDRTGADPNSLTPSSQSKFADPCHSRSN
jgi:hypothetical protein